MQTFQSTQTDVRVQLSRESVLFILLCVHWTQVGSPAANVFSFWGISLSTSQPLLALSTIVVSYWQPSSRCEIGSLFQDIIKITCFDNWPLMNAVLWESMSRVKVCLTVWRPAAANVRTEFVNKDGQTAFILPVSSFCQDEKGSWEPLPLRRQREGSKGVPDLPAMQVIAQRQLTLTTHNSDVDDC